MKKLLALLLVLCLGVLFVLPAVGLNGFVGGMRWANAPRRSLISQASAHVTITRADLAWIINADQSVVTLGFTVHVPSVAAGDPVGAVLMTAAGEIGSWQEGVGAVVQDNANYSLRGAAWFPGEDAANPNHFTFELELGCRNPAAFAALQGLRLQLIDPNGDRSAEINAPIVPEAPVVTTLAATTTVTTTTTTTTRAPTTAMTWAPTTAMTWAAATTATTTTTTTRTTTTRTTAAPWTFAARQPATTRAPATTAAQSTAVTQTFATGPGPTAAQAAATARQTQPPRGGTDSLWTFAQYVPRSFGTVPLPVESAATHAAAPAQAVMPQTPEAPSPARNSSLLYGAGVLLILLALVLVGYWLLAWRREKERQV